MEQFTVPQFIDVEDKIIGPITTRQFVILVVGGILIFIFYKLADFSLFIFLAVFDLVITAVLAFIKINGQPFHYFLLNLIQTFKKPNLRVWNKEISLAEIRAGIKKPSEAIKKTEAVVPKKQVSTSRLSELSLVVDTGGVYQGEEE